MPDDEVQRIAESRLGRVLRGKYRLDAILGVGGMATVYVGTHRNRKRFAVKMLHPDLSIAREHPRALPARGVRRQLGRAPGRRRGARRRRGGGRLGVPRHGAARRRVGRGGAHVAGRPAALAARRVDRRRAARRARRGARQGDRPPRHQAREPLPHVGRLAQGARLRDRAPARRDRQRRDVDGADARDARVHGARAGDGEGCRRRRGDGPVGGGRDALHARSAAASCTRARTRSRS